MKNTDYHLAES